MNIPGNVSGIDNGVDGETESESSCDDAQANDNVFCHLSHHFFISPDKGMSGHTSTIFVLAVHLARCFARFLRHDHLQHHPASELVAPDRHGWAYRDVSSSVTDPIKMVHGFFGIASIEKLHKTKSTRSTAQQPRVINRGTSFRRWRRS